MKRKISLAILGLAGLVVADYSTAESWSHGLVDITESYGDKAKKWGQTRINQLIYKTGA